MSINSRKQNVSRKGKKNTVQKQEITKKSIETGENERGLSRNKRKQKVSRNRRKLKVYRNGRNQKVSRNRRKLKVSRNRRRRKSVSKQRKTKSVQKYNIFLFELSAESATRGERCLQIPDQLPTDDPSQAHQLKARQGLESRNG